MPPRKKSAATTNADAATDTATSKPTSTRTRSSTRQAPPAKPASASVQAPPAKPTSKPRSTKSKRARANSDDEEDGPSKKSKKDDVGDNDNGDVSDGKTSDTEKSKNMVTVVKRGKAPVDPFSQLVNTHLVYADNENVWDAMLNQTEVGSNKNKFYVIQLLHPIADSNCCYLYTRWGRVGENGQSQRKGPWSSAMAVNEFKKQFKSKTGVVWERRHGMTAGKGKYTWLERSFEDDKAESSGTKEDDPVPESKLSSEVQAFCNLIFSSKLMDAHLSSMNYDANKLPLGKLAKSTILNGFAALKKLAEVLEKPDGDLAKSLGGFHAACMHFSGEYYSIIPHAFGRTRPAVINDMITLKKELDLVDALGDMEVTHKLISTDVGKDKDGNALNPLDAHFHSLELTIMDPVPQTSKEFKALAEYVANTHGATHDFHASVLHAFRIERESETLAWHKAGFDGLAPGDRMLLWHGSRTTNFAGILKQGLRIAPPEAPVTGYMFGKGVYFADMMSKSANYCHSYLSNRIGVLLLCEVAAKPFFEQIGANYNADVDCKTHKKLATKGIGRTQPTQWQDAGEALENRALTGCCMPKGTASDVATPGSYLQYNEYIVYHPSQIRVRYLLMVKMA